MAYLGNSLLNKLYSFTPITATAGQTVFAMSYAPGATVFFLTKASTGASKLLLPGTDITATDGSTATLASAAAVGDVLSGISMAQFGVAGALPLIGGTMGGPIVHAGGDTGVTPANGDNSTKLATTAFLLNSFTSGQSLATPSGYQKFPGGLILQWGVVPFVSSNTATITWPIAFPTVAFVAIPVNPTASVSVTTTTITTTNGTFAISASTTTSSPYIVIGK
jgi:hypothetical protein